MLSKFDSCVSGEFAINGSFHELCKLIWPHKVHSISIKGSTVWLFHRCLGGEGGHFPQMSHPGSAIEYGDKKYRNKLEQSMIVNHSKTIRSAISLLCSRYHNRNAQ